MPGPVSPHFAAIDLSTHFNSDRADETGPLAPRHAPVRDWSLDCHGSQSFRGIGFDLGRPGRPNILALRPGNPATVIPVAPRTATYIVFLHAAGHIEPKLPADFDVVGAIPASGGAAGNQLGDRVATYRIDYADGTSSAHPVIRRFGIQQRHIDWSASPFAAVPARGPFVFATASEDALRGRPAEMTWGRSQARTNSGRSNDGENLWLYALPVPKPDMAIVGLSLGDATAPVAIYGIATTTLPDHPFRAHRRSKLKLELPAAIEIDSLGEIDTDDRSGIIGIDLGTVISARAMLRYDDAEWRSDRPDVQPSVAPRTVIVEYAAHPAARIHVGDLAVELGRPRDWPGSVTPVAPAHRRVLIRIRDGQTDATTAARLHLHGPQGEYLPPLGHHRATNPYWFEDMAGELQSGAQHYAYVDGTCHADLPVGRVFVEISKGYEYAPLRTAIDVTPDTAELTFTVERVLDWRARGWLSSDTHVHFLSPQTALLEGQAEGVNVVNLLAAQWGELFSNVADFDGHRVLGARDFGGDGEFLVRVGTENRMHVLGHISLLGYAGPMIQPLSTGGPQEGAIGEALDVTMAEWAEQCRRQGGLVVMPHAPNPQAERAANITAGLVDAVELMTFNPRDAQLNPFGLVDWYRYQNLGHQLPLVGGSDKMAATSVLGGIRTYAHLGQRAFTYADWMAAVRTGNTFVTVGPLVELLVEGRPPGEQIRLPAGGGTVAVDWTVESACVPVDRVELIVGGRVVEVWETRGALSGAGRFALPVPESTWVALRVRGSWRSRPGDIAAHTSAVQVLVGDRPIFAAVEAVEVLRQIEGAIAYVDTLAGRPDPSRYASLRLTLERAHRALHARLHDAGVHHYHLHAPDRPHEH